MILNKKLTPKANSKVYLPYFDEFFNKLNAGDLYFEKIWGTNVHFGYWDKASDTDATASQFIAASKRMNQIMIDRAAISNGMDILDVGCGFGGTIQELDSKYRNLNLTGLNIDIRQIERAKKKVLPYSTNKVSFILGDACAMPFKDNTFDVIIAVECIFHFKERSNFFKEAKRVLKPGGRIIFSDFVYFAPLMFFVYFGLTKLGVFRNWGTVIPASEAGYKILAKKSNFSPPHFTNISKNTYPNFYVVFKRKNKLLKRLAEILFKFLVNTNLVKYMIVNTVAK